mgnify:CR=1 FL=1
MKNPKLTEILTSHQKIVILPHEMPDGDCIGSALALSAGLEQKGIQSTVVVKQPISEMYSFLTGSEKALLPDSLDTKVDAIVFVDCSDTERPGFNIYNLCPNIKTIINIDHHVSNEYFGQYNYVDFKAAATGEIIYHLLKDINVSITADIATGIYTALVTDSGSFQYENTTPTTLRLAAILLELGAKTDLVRKYIWENKSLQHLEVLRVALNSLTLTAKNKIAYIYINQDCMDKLGVSTNEYFDGLINYPKSIGSVEIALFFKEIETNVIKVSMRSKNYVDVNQLAGQFGGGGHIRAAGCTLLCSMNEAIKKVINITEKLI